MEPFNIKINNDGKETTLTILPLDDEYKIIYFGGIIGALKEENAHFNFVKPENVIPGSLPLYKYKQADFTAAETELKLTKEVLEKIVDEVKAILQNT